MGRETVPVDKSGHYEDVDVHQSGFKYVYTSIIPSTANQE